MRSAGIEKKCAGGKKMSSGIFSLFYKVLVSQHLLRGFAFICLYSLFYLSSPLGNNRFCLLLFLFEANHLKTLEILTLSQT